MNHVIRLVNVIFPEVQHKGLTSSINFSTARPEQHEKRDADTGDAKLDASRARSSI